MTKTWWQRFRDWWKRQPDIGVLPSPIMINSNPEPTAFKVEINGQKVKGFLLRKDAKPKVLSERGHSFQISIPKLWVPHLKGKFKPFLVQIHNDLGVFLLPVGDENA
jgi:hypothetical protein